MFKINWLSHVVCGIVVCVSLVSVASADTFGAGANQFTIDFVTISGDTNPTNGYGIVNNNYRMGVYEITNDQWNKFSTSLGVPITGNPSNAYDRDPTWTGANEPTNEVSWYEAAQFINWLNTSTGHQAAYKFNGTQGTTDYAMATWSVAEADGGTNLYRHKNAMYFMPTEDEWVKAAYWNGTNLQTYATKDNTTPNEWSSTGGSNSDGQEAGWNYGYAYPDNSLSTDQPWDVIAGYSPEELNGTFDMMGNVWEWMESPYDDSSYATGSTRARRSASYASSINGLAFSYRDGVSPNLWSDDIGFRVASVPEPATLSLLVLGGLAILKRKRR